MFRLNEIYASFSHKLQNMLGFFADAHIFQADPDALDGNIPISRSFIHKLGWIFDIHSMSCNDRMFNS